MKAMPKSLLLASLVFVVESAGITSASVHSLHKRTRSDSTYNLNEGAKAYDASKRSLDEKKSHLNNKKTALSRTIETKTQDLTSLLDTLVRLPSMVSLVNEKETLVFGIGDYGVKFSRNPKYVSPFFDTKEGATMKVEIFYSKMTRGENRDHITYSFKADDPKATDPTKGEFQMARMLQYVTPTELSNRIAEQLKGWADSNKASEKKIDKEIQRIQSLLE